MERSTLSTMSLNRVLLFVTGGGFVFLFAESIIEHSPILAKELIASFPILFSIAGASMNLVAAITYNREHVTGAAVVNGIGLVVGFVGIVLHNLDRLTIGSAEHSRSDTRSACVHRT